MPGKWLFRFLVGLHVGLYRLSGGTIGGRIRGLPVLLITAVGRKTGQKRTVPVSYIREGSNYIITASNNGADKHPGWYWNLKSNPQSTIEVKKEKISVEAQVANAEEKQRLWAQLVEKAPFFDDYQSRTARDIPMVILRPSD